MIAGPKHWQTVTTDTAGVPHGGLYGDVALFEQEAARHGLKLGWSRAWKAFLIYTQPGPNKYVCQFTCWKGDGTPIPLSRNLLNLLVTEWERFGRTSDQTLHAIMAQQQRDAKAAARKEHSKAMYDAAKEAVSRAWSRQKKRVVFGGTA
jgi:hypothetical protein